MTRTRVTAALLVVAFGVVAATSAVAQEKGKRPQGGGQGGGSLIGNPDVQKELKITDDQKTKITDAMASARPTGGNTNFQDLSQEERTKLFAEMQTRAAEARKKAEAILTADQLKRLNEFKFQQTGALSNPDVQAALKITDDQKAKLQTLAQEMGEKRRGLFQGGGQGGLSQETRDKLNALSKEQDEKSLALLSADQKAQLEKGKGAKADFQLPPYSTFGGGGIGRRPQN